ncbi:MAG: hypothetical protein P4M10_08850, partial [Verrucomicrobiae bacterium]|nr:hypothetical protein [Verrucomicrobiae bacterium]
SVPELQRRVLWMSFFMFASAAAFLVYISVAFDFHDCFYPSREFPYLYCGRQALAALIPFMLVFTTGLDTLLARWRDRSKFILLGALLGLILAAEAAANRELFADSFNWFHL